MKEKIPALKDIYTRFEAKTLAYKNNACMIYEVRPFSCRRIYSTHVCSRENPPRVNRQVMEAAGQSIKELQQLDITGYSGHLSFILYMLSTPAFLDTYMEGKFKPEEIMEFGKTHNIAINKTILTGTSNPNLDKPEPKRF